MKKAEMVSRLRATSSCATIVTASRSEHISPVHTLSTSSATLNSSHPKELKPTLSTPSFGSANDATAATALTDSVDANNTPGTSSEAQHLRKASKRTASSASGKICEYIRFGGLLHKSVVWHRCITPIIAIVIMNFLLQKRHRAQPAIVDRYLTPLLVKMKTTNRNSEREEGSHSYFLLPVSPFFVASKVRHEFIHEIVL
jgi:hypothetical protein